MATLDLLYIGARDSHLDPGAPSGLVLAGNIIMAITGASVSSS